jgi:hypothetical protein
MGDFHISERVNESRLGRFARPSAHRRIEVPFRSPFIFMNFFDYLADIPP